MQLGEGNPGSQGRRELLHWVGNQGNWVGIRGIQVVLQLLLLQSIRRQRGQWRGELGVILVRWAVK